MYLTSTGCTLALTPTDRSQASFLKVHDTLTLNQTRNPTQSSPFVFTPYLHDAFMITSKQTRKPIQSSPFVFTPYLHDAFMITSKQTRKPIQSSSFVFTPYLHTPSHPNRPGNLYSLHHLSSLPTYTMP
ncbi:uncharacterized protein LOC144618972 [Crassostrea virginica]